MGDKKTKYNLGPFTVESIDCINLAHRKDRRQLMRKQSRKKNCPIQIHTRKGDPSNPEKDRFEAHMQIIRQAKQKLSAYFKVQDMLEQKKEQDIKETEAKETGEMRQIDAIGATGPEGAIGATGPNGPIGPINDNKTEDSNDKIKAIMILEDDARILTKVVYIPTPPSDWQMLYLGGNVQKVMKDEEALWKRVCCTMTHAYIIRASLFNVILEKSKDAIGKVSLETFYCNGIHPDYPTYIIAPEYIVQRAGYSDVKKRHLTYGQQATQMYMHKDSALVKSIDSARMVKTEEGYKLDVPAVKEDDLPIITLLTPTTNRKELFSFVIRNFYMLQYPSHKLRWVITDDSNEEQKVREYIPGDDPRIKYVNCKVSDSQHLTLTKKLNLCCAYADPESEYYLVFLDDAYYPPHSAISRVKTLMAYSKEKFCVGCTEFGVFDIENNKSYISHFDDINNNKTILSVASLAFSKQFYENRRFDETTLAFPSFQFCVGRFQEVLQIPYEFICIHLHSDKLNNEARYNQGMNEKEQHKQKKSQHFKQLTKKEDNQEKHEVSPFNFFDTWDHDTREFVLLIKETI